VAVQKSNCIYLSGSLEFFFDVFLDPALNAENIKADRGKILTPTHFSDPKDINAETWGVGVVP
jgi:hypothetical protein